MQCEKCRAEITPGEPVCPECGALTVQNVEGFECTKQIERQLAAMIDQQGKEVIMDSKLFVALIQDFVPEFDKERRLLINMHKAGIIHDMLEEEDQSIGISKARGYMLNDLFIAEHAAEFVLVCFCYMLGWPYESSMREREPEEEDDDFDSIVEVAAPVSMEDKVFMPIDATRFRFKKDIRIPDGYTKIDSFCFDGWGRLKSVVLPDSLMGIGEYAFSECTNLRSIEIPERVKIIKGGAFNQCSKLTIIKIPDGILEIGDNTFAFCESLAEVDVPPSVSSIGVQAFAGCDALKKLYLPESVKFIDESAFLYCPNLTIHCYENSYVHKFCLAHKIRVETVAKGEGLSKK
jgi:hypothetical protein